MPPSCVTIVQMLDCNEWTTTLPSRSEQLVNKSDVGDISPTCTWDRQEPVIHQFFMFPDGLALRPEVSRG